MKLEEVIFLAIAGWALYQSRIPGEDVSPGDDVSPGLPYTGIPSDIPEDVWKSAHRASGKYPVHPALILAIAKRESDFRQDVTGAAGEIGIMQIMPATGTWLGFTQSQLRELDNNFEAGAKYLYYQLRRYDGSTLDAIASYNTGSVKKSNGVYVNLAYVTVVYATFQMYKLRGF